MGRRNNNGFPSLKGRFKSSMVMTVWTRAGCFHPSKEDSKGCKGSALSAAGVRVSIPQRKIQKHIATAAGTEKLLCFHPSKEDSKEASAERLHRSPLVSIPQRKIQKLRQYTATAVLCEFPSLKGRFKSTLSGPL